MPNWGEVLKEITRERQLGQAQAAKALDAVRHGYLLALHKKTQRNVITYYSGFLSKPGIFQQDINDEDKNGFMMAVHGLDKTKGLDLVLHTPGGGIAATESIVNYLHKMFSKDIRAIVPQIAMSAGTMIACSCKKILMGEHSNLGPIDPQLNGIPAKGVTDEFKRAYKEMKKDPTKIRLWEPYSDNIDRLFWPSVSTQLSGRTSLLRTIWQQLCLPEMQTLDERRKKSRRRYWITKRIKLMADIFISKIAEKWDWILIALRTIRNCKI